VQMEIFNGDTFTWKTLKSLSEANKWLDKQMEEYSSEKSK